MEVPVAVRRPVSPAVRKPKVEEERWRYVSTLCNDQGLGCRKMRIALE